MTCIVAKRIRETQTKRALKGIKVGTEVILGRHSMENGRRRAWNDYMERFVGTRARVVKIRTSDVSAREWWVGVDTNTWAWYLEAITKVEE